VFDIADHLPRWLQGPVRRLLVIKGWFVCIASLIMAFTFLFVVILRYGFTTDLFAYEEWLLIVCFWLYFIASALGTYEGSHVNADLLDYYITSPRAQLIRALIVSAVELIVCLAVIYWAILMLYDEIDVYPYWQETIAMKIPFIVPRTAVLVGFLFMTFYTALRIYVLLKLGPRAFDPSSRETTRASETG